MSSFGLITAGDFLQKLRDERADFVLSYCLDPRHALNAIMTGYHLHEWVWAELSRRPDCPYKSHKACRDSLKPVAGSLIEDAGLIADGTKHFLPKKIRTGARKGAFQRGVFQPNAFDVSHLWLERADGQRQRIEDFIDELLAFWDRFFQDNGLAQYANAVGRAGRQLCRCGRELEDFDLRGEVITGCEECNVWSPLAKPPMKLSREDLEALRNRR